MNFVGSFNGTDGFPGLGRISQEIWYSMFVQSISIFAWRNPTCLWAIYPNSCSSNSWLLGFPILLWFNIACPLYLFLLIPSPITVLYIKGRVGSAFCSLVSLVTLGLTQKMTREFMGWGYPHDAEQQFSCHLGPRAFFWGYKLCCGSLYFYNRYHFYRTICLDSTFVEGFEVGSKMGWGREPSHWF